MGVQRSHKLRAVLAASANYTASATLLLQQRLELGGYKSLIITLDVSAADSGGTYNVYVCSGVPVAENPGDGTDVAATTIAEWDIVSFTQIAGTSAKRYVARVLVDRLAEVTSATPGVSAEPASTLEVETSGTNAAKSLTAGKVRHGPFGDFVSVYLVAAGTITTGVTCSVSLTAG